MKKSFKLLLNALLLPFPWVIRRRLYQVFFGYEIDKTAFIGRSLILAEKLVMKSGSRIKSLNFFNEIDEVLLEEYAQVDTRNWITGLSTKYSSNFTYDSKRRCQFKLGKHTRITNLHYIDCTGGVEFGDFCTMAGIRTVILSHSIDIEIGRQRAMPVRIGHYCFIGTHCRLLMDSALPDYSVLAAGAVLSKCFKDPYGIYGGVPAKLIKTIPTDAKYFSRTHGHVT